MTLLERRNLTGTCILMKGLAVSLMLAFGSNVYALPAGGAVVAGGATIGNAAGSTTVTQSSQNAAINWLSFSIGQGETVRFIQPNSSSVALNRVLGPDPSSILGSMSANGKVFLINPNGVLFGKSAQVNVGGLVASTLNMTDSDFMAGRYQFSGSSTASIVNQGSINADGGYVALLGANVGNDGTILARLGTVALAAGNAITLDVAGDGLLNVTVNQGAVNALVQNGGLIQADGGNVLLTAQSAGNLLPSAVNNTGVIQAQTIENHNGTIRLLSDMLSGSVIVGGKVDASAPNGGNGGFIETSAARVALASDVEITTLAPAGLIGTWLIDPKDFTVAVAGGDITGLDLSKNLLAANITISSNDGRVGTAGDILVNAPIHWAGATTLTLNAVHDVHVDAAITADTAGAKLVLKAGNYVASTATIDVVAAGSTITISAVNDVRIGGAITGTAANTAIGISAGQSLSTTAALHTVAADSSITLKAGKDLSVGGAITATAANTTIDMSAGRDLIASAAIAAVAADSAIRMTAGRDVTNTITAAISAGAASTAIELNAGHDVNVNAAIAASAAGSSIRLIAGLDGAGPGVASGTVRIVGAVTSPNVTIRFNPNGYVNTAAEIALYPALADARAWTYLQGNDRIYDGTTAATLSFKGGLLDGGAVTLIAGTATFATREAGTGKAITFNGYAIGGADSKNFALFAGSGTTTADIARRPLNVTAVGTNKVYDGTTADVVTLADKRIVGDVLALSYTIANFTDKNAGNGKDVSISGISVTGPDAANYSFATTAKTTANVTPAPLIVTASDATKTYGQTPILSGFVATGLVNGETIGSVIETSSGLVGTAGVTGGLYPITPSRATGGTFSASNYTISYVNGALAVIPTGLVVTVANESKIFGESVTLTGFTVEGLMNDETVDAVSETSPGAAATASVAGSPYVITPGRASGGTFKPSNYTIVYLNGVLTVRPLAAAGSVAPPELTVVRPVTATPITSFQPSPGI